MQPGFQTPQLWWPLWLVWAVRGPGGSTAAYIYLGCPADSRPQQVLEYLRLEQFYCLNFSVAEWSSWQTPLSELTPPLFKHDRKAGHAINTTCVTAKPTFLLPVIQLRPVLTFLFSSEESCSLGPMEGYWWRILISFFFSLTYFERGGEREQKKERESQASSTVMEPEPMNCEIMTGAETKSDA